MEKSDMEIAQEIISVLKQNPNATIQEISEETETDESKIVMIMDNYENDGGTVKQVDSGTGKSWATVE